MLSAYAARCCFRAGRQSEDFNEQKAKNRREPNGGNNQDSNLRRVGSFFAFSVFLLYGKKQRALKQQQVRTRVRLPFKPKQSRTPSPIPKLSPQELVSGLQSAGLDCVITQRSTLTDGSLECSLMLNRISGDGRLVVKPDSNGGTAECILEFNYIYAEILDDPETDAVARTLKEQYELREKYDAELIDGFIRSLAELFADKEEYNSVDLEKIISGTVSAYKSMKTYDRYLGDIHFYINTKLTDFNAEVKLIAAVRKK